jgi:hypothetical protein
MQPTYQYPPPSRPKKRHRVLIASILGLAATLVLCGIVVIAAGPGGDASGDIAVATATTAATPPAKVAAAPHVAKTALAVHGKGIKKTALFAVPAEWTLAYSYDCAAFGYAGNFAVTEYKATGSMVDVLVNELGDKGSDTSAQHADAGQRYLEVNSECDWSMKVVG